MILLCYVLLFCIRDFIVLMRKRLGIFVGLRGFFYYKFKVYELRVN